MLLLLTMLRWTEPKVTASSTSPSTKNKPGKAPELQDLEIPSPVLTVMVRREELLAMGSGWICLVLEEAGEIFFQHQQGQDEDLQQHMLVAAIMASHLRGVFILVGNLAVDSAG
jgi:hypothetical protein